MKRTNMAEARAKFPELIRRVTEGETVVVGRYGVPVAVVLSYKKFEEMEEDLEDLRAVLEAELEAKHSGGKGRTIDQVLSVSPAKTKR